MPPIKDALSLHIERANYQCQLCKKALDYHPHLLHPVEHGWTDIDGSLAVQWRHLKPGPDSILEFVSCSCKKSECATNHCSCAAVNLPCTGLCCCSNCKKNDIRERVDVNETFHDHDDFGEYQDGGTDGEADDSSDSSEDELFDDEIEND